MTRRRHARLEKVTRRRHARFFAAQVLYGHANRVRRAGEQARRGLQLCRPVEQVPSLRPRILSILGAGRGSRHPSQSIPLLLPLLLTQPGRNHDPRPSLHPRSNVPAPPPAADATRDDPSAHDVYKCFCYSEEYKVSSQ